MNNNKNNEHRTTNNTKAEAHFIDTAPLQKTLQELRTSVAQSLQEAERPIIPLPVRPIAVWNTPLIKYVSISCNLVPERPLTLHAHYSETHHRSAFQVRRMFIPS
jgi:hypothetical protein